MCIRHFLLIFFSELWEYFFLYEPSSNCGIVIVSLLNFKPNSDLGTWKLITGSGWRRCISWLAKFERQWESTSRIGKGYQNLQNMKGSKLAPKNGIIRLVEFINTLNCYCYTSGLNCYCYTSGWSLWRPSRILRIKNKCS